ncbi:hypothetical protein PSTG_06091 [Puccinia striiformis f. sp. tritici PST-78]|uniref:Uncharacterized protein n=1 Tax=Puccinia striiformis f. sp. tritici PST-78 TaxID=1165861 RepID=A0A0L0VN18_9BASI|nr:hypothetical protein PSTG_06091 [Puccinia striiformis f. sp. tritici PST-78]
MWITCYKPRPPVNVLKWWIQQKRAGNTHGGLVHMALDVQSCPGENIEAY